MMPLTLCSVDEYRAPLLSKCPQYQGHKGDTKVILGTCVMLSEGTQKDLVLGMDLKRFTSID
jgi:hypothetical protein